MYKFLFIFIVLCVSCSEQKINELENIHQAKIDSIKSSYESKEKILIELTEVLSEVQSGVTQVSKKAGNLQKLNKAKASDRTKIVNIKEQIATELSFIENEIAKNKKNLSKLHSRLNNSLGDVENLKNIVLNLEETIKNKEEEITFLKEELIKKESELEEAFVTINENFTKIKSLNTQLETVYYIVETEEKLEDAGVVERHGGFLGINSKLTLTNDFSLEPFNKKNLKHFSKLSLDYSVDTFQILSNHPKSSYKVDAKGNKSELIILDKSLFWSASKFLTIVVD